MSKFSITAFYSNPIQTVKEYPVSSMAAVIMIIGMFMYTAFEKVIGLWMVLGTFIIIFVDLSKPRNQVNNIQQTSQPSPS